MDNRVTKKEVRYALVLNGGVSLAVWMGGVARELNQLRLASENDESTSVWRKILEAADAKPRLISSRVRVLAASTAPSWRPRLPAAATCPICGRGGPRWRRSKSGIHPRRSEDGSLGARRRTLQGTPRRSIGRDRARGRPRERMHAVHNGDSAGLTNQTEVAGRQDGDTADGRRVYKFVRRNAIKVRTRSTILRATMLSTLVTAARDGGVSHRVRARRRNPRVAAATRPSGTEEAPPTAGRR